MIPAYFDHNYDLSRKPYFNGFSIDWYASVLKQNTNQSEYDSFMQSNDHFNMRLFNKIALEDTFQLIEQTFNGQFVWPLGIHWWMQSSDMSIWDDIEIPPFVVNSIIKKQCKILLYNPFEGWELSWWKKLVDRIVSKNHSISSDDFVITSNNLSTVDVGIKNIPIVNTLIYQSPGIYENFSNYYNIISDRISNLANRQYKFVCLNRRPSTSRWATVTMLHEHKDQGLLSFSVDTNLNTVVSSDNYRQETIHQFQIDLKNRKSQMNVSIKDFATNMPIIHKQFKKSNVIKSLPMFIDDGIDSRINPTTDSSVFKFTDSYLHIVTETYFQTNNDCNHVSEKTFKPIWYMQPFVIIGPASTLQHLRQLGFKTFDLWLNEDYDEIIDPQERLTSAINSAKDFYNRPQSIVSNDLRDMLPILQHNHLMIHNMIDNFSIADYFLKIF